MSAFDVQVLGAGIVGKSLALALSRLGLSVALRGADRPRADSADVRAYALSPASVALLRGLKVWEALPAHAATPVYDMQVQGDAPGAAIEFSAWEQRVGELAWITDAALLERELSAAVRFAPHVELADGPVDATLTALCEGASSSRRAELGVQFQRHDYGHRAIAARLAASQPHRGIARQWFRHPDVLALLPFDAPEPGRSYGLVWSLPNDKADALLAQSAVAFEQSLMEATGGVAGDLKLASERAAWPLQLGRADRWCGPGWVLLGDAAHVVHPLAGQGLNLGLADVAALARVIREREPWRGLGDERLLRRYASERAAPTWAMGEVTDGLLRLFSHESPALRELRNRGLNLVNRLTPVKRWLTSQALDS
jgi:ubiquinone biosynthesis UbiH/UbiF/VisC/COQ6 family hydroxylase